MAYYLGRRPQGDWVTFQSKARPNRETHGMRFTSAIGPFKSRVAASWYHRYGRNDPRIRTPADAERLARVDPRMELAIVEEAMSAEERQEALANEWFERGVDELIANRERPINPEDADESFVTPDE